MNNNRRPGIKDNVPSEYLNFSHTDRLCGRKIGVGSDGQGDPMNESYYLVINMTEAF